MWQLIHIRVGAGGIGRVSPWLGLERWGGIRGEEEESRSVPHWMSNMATASDMGFQGVLSGWGSWSLGFKHYRSLECYIRASRLYVGQCGAPEGFYMYSIYGSYNSLLLKRNILMFFCFVLNAFLTPSQHRQYTVYLLNSGSDDRRKIELTFLSCCSHH